MGSTGLERSFLFHVVTLVDKEAISLREVCTKSFAKNVSKKKGELQIPVSQLTSVEERMFLDRPDDRVDADDVDDIAHTAPA